MFARIRSLFSRHANANACVAAASTDLTAPPAETALLAQDKAFLELVTATCTRVAEGDLEARVTGYGDHPHYAPMIHAINSLLDRTDSYVRETAAAMQTCSNEQFHRPILLRGMKGSFKRSSVIINRAAVKMETSHRQLARVAQLAQENTTTVTTVAAACEELHATTGEISVRVRQSSAVTRSAVAECDRVSEAVNAMMITAQKAETMITLIDQIAAQTKLLALNASITASPRRPLRNALRRRGHGGQSAGPQHRLGDRKHPPASGGDPANNERNPIRHRRPGLFHGADRRDFALHLQLDPGPGHRNR
jgi:hypothetical protein